jgi:hypothetical protein
MADGSIKPTDSNCECGPACPPEKPKSKLRAMFSKCAACGTGGGLLAGHAGCIITPVVVAAVGVTTATAGMSVIALAFGAATTAGGLYAWHKLRGPKAGKWEKRTVIGGAIAGLFLSAAMQLGGMHHQHHAPEAAPQKQEQTVQPPKPAQHHHH